MLCLIFVFFYDMNRHIYVADVLAHNVHVFERKEDNALAFVKVK